ncbi:uncharacterized protein SRS1_00842 [Sporisorium reilianum f. sp. reilianum]|uniref:Carbohydrate kinase PfkB domain-containing protein n=1 Tax=Sporisorium reilianum f. sp. reilianum TaxID=72559 RepID=A0A2N8U4T9_9BASI|nr:uncharacterized protein SRS1_00842 [Sporisorium reilianum f. sp. reilianum]
MAETATRVLSSSSPSPVKLISPHGNDDFGLLLRTGMQQAGMRTDGLFVPEGSVGECRTAVCSLMLDDAGDLISGVADMDIGHKALYPRAGAEPEQLERLLASEAPEALVFDGNVGSEQAGELLRACEAYNGDRGNNQRPKLLTLFEPTSIAKSTIVLQHYAEAKAKGLSSQPISFATPNAVELENIHKVSTQLGLTPTLASSNSPATAIPSSVIDPATLSQAQALVTAGIFATILLKVGRHGVITIDVDNVKHHPIPAGEVKVVNTTGCGDSFAGAFTATLCHLLSKDNVKWFDAVDKAVEVGQRAARNTLASTKAVGDGMHLLLREYLP